MNRIDDLLQAAVSEQDLDVPALTPDEIDRIARLAINKLPKTRKKPGKKKLTLLIAAAICVIGTATAFAAAYHRSIGEIFEPVFEEQNDAGEIVPVNEKLPLLEKSGVVIDQTLVRGDLSVTIWGVVGDSESVSLMLEVSDINGNPIGNNELPESGQFRFDRAYLHIDAGQDGAFEATGQYCNTIRIDDGSDPSKMTFLIQEDIYYTDIVGKKATLELSGLGELAIENASQVTLDYPGLLELSRNFPSPEEESFIYRIIPDEILQARREASTISGRSLLAYLKRDNAGNYITDPHLPDTGVKLPLSPDYPNTYVVAMGFFQDEFHMALICEDKREFETITNNCLGVTNQKTGEVYPKCGMSYDFTDPDINWDESAFIHNDFYPDYMQTALGAGRIYFTVESCADLKDLVLTTGGSYYFKPISDEEWRFEFDLAYENTSLVYEPADSVLWEGNGFTVDRISISPFSFKISCSGWSRAAGAAPLNFPVTLHMKDGSVLQLHNMTRRSREGSFECHAVMPVVIDAGQVESVSIGGHNIIL